MLDFLAYLEFERGLSRNTLEAYRSDLLQFGAYLRRARRRRADRPARRPRRLPRRARRRAATSAAPVAPATLQRKAACLRSFYRHLRREGVIDHDPTADLRAPRKSQKLPQVLSRAARSRGCSRAARAPSPRALRDRALLELMYACGLRASRGDRPRAWATSTSRPACCAPAARAPRSASSRSAARRSPRCAPTSARAPGARRPPRRAAPVRQPARRRA